MQRWAEPVECWGYPGTPARYGFSGATPSYVQGDTMESGPPQHRFLSGCCVLLVWSSLWTTALSAQKTISGNAQETLHWAMLGTLCLTAHRRDPMPGSTQEHVGARDRSCTSCKESLQSFSITCTGFIFLKEHVKGYVILHTITGPGKAEQQHKEK